jgi:formylglycine-generating enzyme required for sulfatase activity
MLMPSRTIPLILGLLAILPVQNLSQDGDKSVPKTSPEKVDEKIIQRFVEECVLIQPGIDPFPETFQMGGLNEGPRSLSPKSVAMPIKFRINRYEVTQELYETVMGVNPSRWKGPRNSVEMVSFQDAEKFCTKLTVLLQAKKMIAANEEVRLPTEAEWEYCCRAGTTTRYSFGDSATADGDQKPQASILNDYAWHTGNAAGNDPAVGSLKPNPWGLYDMHGYLWEFVSDPYPSGPEKSATRIVRGGSWRDDFTMLTSAWRSTLPHDSTSDAIGFRCVIAEQSQVQGRVR